MSRTNSNEHLFPSADVHRRRALALRVPSGCRKLCCIACRFDRGFLPNTVKEIFAVYHVIRHSPNPSRRTFGRRYDRGVVSE